MEAPTPDPDATVQTVDTLGHAIDDALGWDVLEEHRALAQIESRMFARARDPVRLSRYLLLRPLGSGGTGVVYDGYDPELARRVAIKVLRSGRNDHESVQRARARFVREAQSIARLSHSNVIAVYDVGTYSADELAPGTREGLERGSVQDAGVFIVMELVDGHDLATWLERDARTWREVIEVFLAAGEGLAAAHAAGIVHRDFKPGNVLVGEDGRVKVVDFGLALTYGGSLSESSSVGVVTPVPSELVSSSFSEDGSEQGALDKLTRTGVLLGTPAYMAPEQHRGEPADQKADQFAFCASLYRALHGQHAFEGRKMKALFENKAAGNIRPIPEASRAPAWVERVVLRGLAAEPSQRFANMEALLQALRADPWRRVGRWSRWAAIPIALAAVAYAGYQATRPGEVAVAVMANGEPVAGSRTFIDDTELVAGRGEVAAGLHRVRVTAVDYEPVETVVEVQRGGVHEVSVELRHEQGTFELELEPGGGQVLVDGQDYGSRLRALQIDTGVHQLLLRHEGYVDEQLQWTAKAGQTERGFVALRKALVWSRPASGSYLEAHWLGDTNGDGLDELVQRRFNLLTAYDPWNDGEQWRVGLREGSMHRLCDVDGDGAQDVLVLHPSGDRTLRLYDGRWTGERRPKPRWTAEGSTEESEFSGLGEVACVSQPDGGVSLVVAGLWPGRVQGLGADGAPTWSIALDDEPIGLAVGHDAAGQRTVDALGLEGVHRMTATGDPVWSTAMPVAVRDDEGQPHRKWFERMQRRSQIARSSIMALGLDRAPGDDVLLALSGEKGDGATVIALDGVDGQERWRADSSRPLPSERPWEWGDVDGDGAHDILVMPKDEDSVAMISGRSGRPLWTRPRETGAAQLLMTRPAPMVVVGGADGRQTGSVGIELLDAMTGTPYASHELERAASSSFVVVDWDGDGRDDVVVGTQDGVLRAFDIRLRPLGSVPLRIPVGRIEATRDGNRDGFIDLLLERRGPAVVIGPKVRWDRRPLDAIRATPVVEDFDGDGELEVALFGPLDKANQLEIVDARTGEVEISSRPQDTQTVIRPPALLPTATGFDLLAVGGGVRRFSGTDASLVARYDTNTAYASPTVADVDGDGTLEVTMVTWEDPGTVHVLDAQTLELRWKWELGRMGSFGAPWIGDVDGDGHNEILVAGLDGKVTCLSKEGTVQWVSDTGGRLNFQPTVADLEGDGTMQILVTPDMPDDPLVVLEGIDGQERARWVKVATRRARPQVSDVDGDGRPELFTASGKQGLFSLDAQGNVRWRYGFVDDGGYQAGAAGSPIVADLDGDGRREIVAGFEDGSVHVVDARDGTLLWRFRTGREEVEASPAVGDVDGDGRQEVFVAGHDRHLFCLDHGPG